MTKYTKLKADSNSQTFLPIENQQKKISDF